MRRNGFTLLEVLISIAIVAVIAAMAIPRFPDQTTSGAPKACKANLQTIEMALETYYSENGSYPTSGLSSATPGDLDTLVNQGYLKTKPVCSSTGVYLWNTSETASQFTFKSGGSTTNASRYGPGRAFCNVHGTFEEWNSTGTVGGGTPR